MTVLGSIMGTGGLAALYSAWSSRRSERETARAKRRIDDFTILSGTVASLQAETTRLQESLAETNRQLDVAQHKAETLNVELDAAQENVRILSRHIRQFLPEVPFPRLVHMNEV